MSLDLYARSEHLLGIEESTQFLHDAFATTLSEYKVNTVLDIGCGRGGLIERLTHEDIAAKGIDLSPVMVKEAVARGYDVECVDVSDYSGQFDAAVAVFDVLNFMDADGLETFLEGVSKILKPNGIFIADINSKHGFSEVAEGTMNAEDEKHFLSVDAVYSDDELRTVLTLFTQNDEDSYSKEQGIITQYFHGLRFFRKKRTLRLVKNENISLYDTNDKILLIFKKEG